MKFRLITLLAGWLLSTWVQVPGTLQTRLKTAATWLKTVICEKWTAYRSAKI